MLVISSKKQLDQIPALATRWFTANIHQHIILGNSIAKERKRTWHEQLCRTNIAYYLPLNKYRTVIYVARGLVQIYNIGIFNLKRIIQL